jgi:hypothetical protein
MKAREELKSHEAIKAWLNVYWHTFARQSTSPDQVYDSLAFHASFAFRTSRASRTSRARRAFPAAVRLREHCLTLLPAEPWRA